MKVGNKILIVTAIFIFVVNGMAFAQRPTGHAELWQSVQSYWDLWAKKDLDGYMKYHHDAFSGWDYKNAMHRKKESVKEQMAYIFKTREFITYDVSPIDIKIHGNTAVIHYYYSFLQIDSKGLEKEIHGRRTDVLIFENEQWMIIASHGGKTDRSDTD